MITITHQYYHYTFAQVRLSAVKPIVVRAVFRCGNCGYGVTEADPRGNLAWPRQARGQLWSF